MIIAVREPLNSAGGHFQKTLDTLVRGGTFVGFTKLFEDEATGSGVGVHCWLEGMFAIEGGSAFAAKCTGG
ncbi:hypothetical protein PF010_g10508 [Phytophthora fragariae]|uniref:Uncharacterized protein n=1 Tax=Phytophthora fragariae TaxID=53985 RepID=A0A6A3LPI2_9STRA|nr:hypothetical protein PF011_g6395 [Phytophthora fragariae]KAE9112278.1 hypothetical protein PF010_g10508 [Phytophthora fragariae]KAE9242756.1 hypothetical protein PF004_g6475 [Phytophthora fragariae]